MSTVSFRWIHRVISLIVAKVLLLSFRQVPVATRPDPAILGQVNPGDTSRDIIALSCTGNNITRVEQTTTTYGLEDTMDDLQLGQINGPIPANYNAEEADNLEDVSSHFHCAVAAYG